MRGIGRPHTKASVGLERGVSQGVSAASGGLPDGGVVVAQPTRCAADAADGGHSEADAMTDAPAEEGAQFGRASSTLALLGGEVMARFWRQGGEHGGGGGRHG